MKPTPFKNRKYTINMINFLLNYLELSICPSCKGKLDTCDNCDDRGFIERIKKE